LSRQTQVPCQGAKSYKQGDCASRLSGSGNRPLTCIIRFEETDFLLRNPADNLRV